MSDTLALSAITQTRNGAETVELRRFQAATPPDAAQQFEAFVLQSFVQELMPKEANSVFGQGLAGEYWRSMLSDRLAEVMAVRGDTGIADYLRTGAGSGVALGAEGPGMRAQNVDLALSATAMLKAGATSYGREDK